MSQTKPDQLREQITRESTRGQRQDKRTSAQRDADEVRLRNAAQPPNLLLTAGTVLNVLSMAQLGGFPLMRVRPVFQDGIAQPAIDIQIDYNDRQSPPWNRIRVEVSPEQYEDENRIF
jgi:hypothetical protein